MKLFYSTVKTAFIYYDIACAIKYKTQNLYRMDHLSHSNVLVILLFYQY